MGTTNVSLRLAIEVSDEAADLLEALVSDFLQDVNDLVNGKYDRAAAELPPYLGAGFNDEGSDAPAEYGPTDFDRR